MAIILNKLDGSPPVRSSLMTVELLGLDVQMRDIDVSGGETRTPEYLAKNPLHSVPLLEDGDFYLADSHAIITYLVSKYGGEKREQLYPSDLQKKALVDSLLFLDASVLFARFATAFRHIRDTKAPGISAEHATAIDEAYGFLDSYLQKNTYLAGNEITLADVACIASVSSIACLVPIDQKHEKLNKWFARLSERDWYKEKNAPGLAQFNNLLQTLLKNNAE